MRWLFSDTAPPSHSEIEAKLRLELTMQRGLRIHAGDQTEVGLVDIQNEARSRRIGGVGLGMVEYIRCVHTELQAFGLTDLDQLAQIRVEAPDPRSFYRANAKRASPSGKGILKKDLAGLGIRDGVDCA